MNNKFFGKKALAPVVATLLLVLLTVVAIGIIAGFVIPFVKNSLAESSSCIDYRDYFKFQEKFESSSGAVQKYNCYDSISATHYYSASIKTSPASSEIAGKITGFKLVFYNFDGSSKVVIAEAGKLSSEIWKLNNQGTEITIPKPGEVRTYAVDLGSTSSTAGYSKMEVYPIVSGDKTCDLADSINIISCSGIVIS